MKKWILFGFLFLSFSSCNSYLADGIRIGWGKQLFQQGYYHEALLYFLKAEQNRKSILLTEQKIPSNSDLLPLRRIQYNVALVYSALGQSRAALKRWQQILDYGGLSEDDALYFSTLYNTGLVYGQTGENQKAHQNLVRALHLRPNHEGARIALELNLQRLAQNRSDKSLPDAEEKIGLAEPPSTGGGISEDEILNYISRQANYRFRKDAKTKRVLRNDW